MQGHLAATGLIVHLLRLCCPYQPEFGTIPILEFDISHGLDGYQNTMRQKKRREQALAPFFVGYDHDIPVTPLLNPRTGLSSYHIIRLVDESSGKYRVDLLMQDTDLYFVAFRREVILTEEERQEGKVGGWGRWQRFDNACVPDFLNARNMGIRNSYGERGDVRPGGYVSLQHIYFTLGAFEDDAVAGTELKKAAYCVMTMFCETSRLRSMLNEVSRRIRDGSSPAILVDGLWKRIKAWGRLGTEALRCTLDNQLQPQVNLPDWCFADCGLARVDDLVGPRGEVALIRINDEVLGVTKAQLEELVTHDGMGDGQEPGFQHDDIGDGQEPGFQQPE